MKSLELNWVRNEDKSLVIPEVIFASVENIGGYYLEPEHREHFIGNRFVDGRFGVIVVSVFDQPFEATLSHEWRHHWQVCHGWEYDGINWNSPADYDAGIREYFRRSRSELDALRFQVRHSRAAYHDEWLRIVGPELVLSN